jgi:hypothetical protein
MDTSPGKQFEPLPSASRSGTLVCDDKEQLRLSGQVMLAVWGCCSEQCRFGHSSTASNRDGSGMLIVPGWLARPVTRPLVSSALQIDCEARMDYSAVSLLRLCCSG